MTVGRWMLTALLLIAIVLSFLVFGVISDDPYADASAGEAGPLSWWIVPLLYSVVGILIAAILFCIGMVVRGLLRRSST